MTFDSDKGSATTSGEPPPVFPPLAEESYTSSESLSVDTPARDLVADIYKILIASSKLLTIEEIQAELGEPRIPEGPIVAALEQLLGEKKVSKGSKDTNDAYELSESAGVTLQRAEDVLSVLLTPEAVASSDHGGGPGIIYTRNLPEIVRLVALWHGRPRTDVRVQEDLAGWVQSSTVTKTDTALMPVYEPTAEAIELAARKGRYALLAKRFPLLVEDLAEKVGKLEKSLATEREAHGLSKKKLDGATGRVTELCSWFHGHGLPVPGASAAKREVTTWSQQRKRTSKELERMCAERRQLRQYRDALVVKHDSEKKEHKAEIERLDESIRHLEDSETATSYMLTKRAYKTVEDGKIAVYSADPWDEGTLLDREDVPAAVEPTSAPPLIPPSEAALSDAPAGEAPDAAAQAAEAAVAKKADEASQAPAGPKGKLTVERLIEEGEKLLRARGVDGLDLAEAPYELAAQLSGRVTEGQKALGRQALKQLVDAGKAVQRKGALVWAELVDPGEEADAQEEDGDAEPESEETKPEAPAAKKRGRPKGSKNKAKGAE